MKATTFPWLEAPMLRRRIPASALLAFALVLTLSHSHAMAQISPGKLVTIGLGGGVSVPIGDAGDALKNGYHLRGFVKVKPPVLPLGFRGALGYQKLDLDQLATGIPASANPEGSTNILSGLGGVTLGMSMGPIHP